MMSKTIDDQPISWTIHHNLSDDIPHLICNLQAILSP